MVLYGSSFINLIFGFRELAAVLAHVGSHCVTGIALPPVDATRLFFHRRFGRCARVRGMTGLDPIEKFVLVVGLA
jgi:hypothetical protein